MGKIEQLSKEPKSFCTQNDIPSVTPTNAAEMFHLKMQRNQLKSDRVILDRFVRPQGLIE